MGSYRNEPNREITERNRYMQLSNRLQMAASLIGEGYMLVDVGTDHGYVPIALMEQGKISGAYALDIHPGPLERAMTHIQQGGWNEKIIPVQSNGLRGLSAEKIVSPAALLIAGMGGGLMISILEDSWDKVQRFERIVLSPHSDVENVRRFLYSKHMYIVQEEMLKEDGKYYSFFVCINNKQSQYNQHNAGEVISEELICQVEWKYGKYLLENRNKVLLDYLQTQHRNLQALQVNMIEAAKTSTRAKERLQQVQGELCLNERAMGYYK